LVEVEASPEKDFAVVYWMVYEVESFSDTVLDSKGLTFSYGEYDGVTTLEYVIPRERRILY